MNLRYASRQVKWPAARKGDDMTMAEHRDSIETLTQLTEGWKATLQEYREALASSSLDQARNAERERQRLFSELRAVVDQLRAEHPDDASLRAAWEQFHQVRGFLLFGTAERITPYLGKLIRRSFADWQPLAPGTVQSINPRAAHNNWVTEGWPQRLLRARISQDGMTQKEAAHACGIAEQSYERWERGEQPPAIGNIRKALAFIRSAEEKAGPQLVDQQPGAASR